MRTPGISLEALDGRVLVPQGQVATVRMLVRGTNGGKVSVAMRIASCPQEWNVRLTPEDVIVGPKQREAIVTAAFAVPDNAELGEEELIVEAVHDDGRTAVGFPIHVHSRKRRWGVLTAIGLGVGAAGGAAYATWRWMKKN